MKIITPSNSMYYGANPATMRAAARLRKNLTLSEFLLWKRLRDRKIFNTKFRKQHPVNNFIVDFYCHEYKLVIEEILNTITSDTPLQGGRGAKRTRGC